MTKWWVAGPMRMAKHWTVHPASEERPWVEQLGVDVVGPFDSEAEARAAQRLLDQEAPYDGP